MQHQPVTVPKNVVLPHRDLYHPNAVDNFNRYTPIPNELANMRRSMPERMYKTFDVVQEQLLHWDLDFKWISVKRMMELARLSNPSVVQGLRELEYLSYFYIYIEPRSIDFETGKPYKYGKRFYFQRNKENRVRIVALSLGLEKMKADQGDWDGVLFSSFETLVAKLIERLGLDVVEAILDDRPESFRSAAYRRFSTGMSKEEKPEEKDFEVLVNGKYYSNKDLYMMYWGLNDLGPSKLPQIPVSCVATRLKWRRENLDFVEKVPIKSVKFKNVISVLERETSGSEQLPGKLDEVIRFADLRNDEVRVFCSEEYQVLQLEKYHRMRFTQAFFTITGKLRPVRFMALKSPRAG